MGTILLIFFTSLLTLAALILTIVGAVKNNKKLMFGAIAGFFVSGVATALIIICSVKNLVDSVTSEIVTDEMSEVSENGAKVAGKVIRGTLTGVIDGLDSESMRVDSSVVQAGIVVNHCENVYNGLSIYFDFTKDFDGVLTLYAYDASDKKQGFAQDSIHAKAGDEGVHVFDFKDGANSGFSGYYALTIKQ